MMRSPYSQAVSIAWEDPGWRRLAHDWINAELGYANLTLVGPISQPHVRMWSTVMRVPTDGGIVWFKANMDALRHEAVVTETLSRRIPDLVPPLLAVNPETGWMLMTDAGRQLRAVVAEEGSLHRWFDVLRRYARLQLEAMDDVAELLAAGVPDLRLTTLAEKYEQLVQQVDVEQRFRDAVPHVAELCDQLASYQIPETIQHDDLHDGQVFVHAGRHLILDWGDACVSHPFFTLSVALEGQIAWGLEDEEHSVDIAPYRDAYLEPFQPEYGSHLTDAVEMGLRLGWACRAINGHIPGQEAQTRTRLRMFLDGHP